MIHGLFHHQIEHFDCDDGEAYKCEQIDPAEMLLLDICLGLVCEVWNTDIPSMFPPEVRMFFRRIFLHIVLHDSLGRELCKVQLFVDLKRREHVNFIFYVYDI